jgi:hypothetical protein
LNTQVTGLHKTIENLNACFLTFTDDLVASGLLEQDPQVTKSLQRTIEHFINVVRASNVIEDDNPTTCDDGDSGSAATDSAATDSPISESSQEAAPLPVIESTVTISDTGMNSSTRLAQDIHATFDRSWNNATSDRKEMAVQFVRDTRLSEASNAPNGATSFQNFPFELVPDQNYLFNYIPPTPPLMGLFKLTFAQKLHMEAIRAGLRLVYAAEEGSQLFYRVFNCFLDFPTRESYRAHLNRVLYENFNYSLQPPPESNPSELWSGGESYVWLNASDVASHFRAIGMDFDSSLDVVNVEINPRYLPTMQHDMQDLPITRPVSPAGDSFTESQHQQPPREVTSLSSTAYQHFTGGPQNSSRFRASAIDPAHSTGSYERSFMSVDVSKLIHGENPVP